MLDVNKEQGIIRAYGVIGDYEGAMAETDFMTALDIMGGDDVSIRLNSEGGSVTSGLSVYNQLRQYPGNVEIQVDAMAASIASVVLMGADRVMANQNSTIMVHDCWTVAMGNAAEFIELAGVLDLLSDQIADIYAARTGGERAGWREIMKAEKYFNAEEALELGLIDGIIEAPKAKRAAKIRKPVAVVDPAFTYGESALSAKLHALRLRAR